MCNYTLRFLFERRQFNISFISTTGIIMPSSVPPSDKPSMSQKPTNITIPDAINSSLFQPIYVSIFYTNDDFVFICTFCFQEAKQKPSPKSKPIRFSSINFTIYMKYSFRVIDSRKSDYYLSCSLVVQVNCQVYPRMS